MTEQAYQIKITREALQLVFNALADLPYKTVSALINDLVAQAQAQDVEAANNANPPESE